MVDFIIFFSCSRLQIFMCLFAFLRRTMASNSRPSQRKTWMLSCAASCPEICGLLRDRCGELEIDEYYSIVDDGVRHALLHLDRKVRITALKRSIDSLAGCGVVEDVKITGYDYANKSAADERWFSMLERGLVDGGVGVAMWVRPGKSRFFFIGVAVVQEVAGGGGCDELPVGSGRSKRVRNAAASMREAKEEAHFLNQLEEKDRLLSERVAAHGLELAEMDAQHGLALADKDCELRRALASRDEEVRLLLVQREMDDTLQLRATERELADLTLRSEQSDAVIAKLTSSISNLEAQLALAASTEKELRSSRGDPTQRETVLVVDLCAERRRVRELLLRLGAAETKATDALARAETIGRQSAMKLSELEGEVSMMRRESGAWEHDRELRRAELEKASAELRALRASHRELAARCEKGETEVAALRERAYEIVRFEMDDGVKRAQDFAESAVASVQHKMDHSNAEWKRRAEGLRDELACATRELAGLRRTHSAVAEK